MTHSVKQTMTGLAGAIALAGVFVLPLSVSLGGFGQASAQMAGESATIRFELTGFDGQTGQVSIALYADAETWLGDNAVISRSVPVDGASVTVIFDGLPPGQYAAVAYHDANANGDLDTGVMGIPSERLGYSAGARGRFGPARFDAAIINLSAGDDRAEHIRLAGAMD